MTCKSSLHCTSEIQSPSNNSLIASITKSLCNLAERLFDLREYAGSNLKGILYPSRIVFKINSGASIFSQSVYPVLDKTEQVI